jgi:site-specific recombinase XerD
MLQNTLPLAANTLELVALRPDLDGSAGANRTSGHNQLGATDDAAAVRQFLAEYTLSPATARTYRKEVERLLLWAVVQRGKPLSSLNRDDFVAYAAFLADPQPAALWCGPRRSRQGTADGGWRPFVGPLSPAARRSALTIINSLMTYLVHARYLAANPLSLVRQRTRHAETMARHAVLQRVFDDMQWAALVAELQGDDASPERERERFLVALLYFLALRVGELTTHTMGDFRQVRDRWSFFVLGKGHKPAEIPVNDALLTALARYRQSMQLPPLPKPHDTMPLLPAGRDGQALGARRVNQIIKDLVERAARRLDEQEPDKAAHMRLASAHWFRHTSLTRQAAKGIHLNHLKANARHSKLDTTMLYIHNEADARHDEMGKHTWL